MAIDLELKPVEAVIYAGDYRLVFNQDSAWPFWIENKDGEGMAFAEPEMAEVLDKFFRENF